MNSLDLPIDRSFAKRLNVERLCNAENMQWEKNLDLHLHFVSTTGCIASYLYLYIFPYLYFIFIFIFFLYLVALFLIFIIVVAVGALYWSENPIETFQISGKYTKYYKYLAYTQNISNTQWTWIKVKTARKIYRSQWAGSGWSTRPASGGQKLGEGSGTVGPGV